MPISQGTSRYPKEVNITQTAVPTTTAAQTSTDTDIVRLSLTNTTASTILFTLTDSDDAVLSNFDEVPIDPNTPYSFEFVAAPLFASGGIKMVADGAGLLYDLHGFRHPAYT